MIVRNHSIEWYAAKLDRGEPFSVLTYGDGEFMVASGRFVGKAVSGAREVVTEQLRDEMRASFVEPDWVIGTGKGDPEGSYVAHNEILRGSDPNILDPSLYQGRDVATMQACHDQAREFIALVPEWVDGCVWDVAAREGRLGPLLRALRKREVALIASERVLSCKAVRQQYSMAVPEQDAASSIDRLEANADLRPGMVVVVCCGLSAIPLIMRLRRKYPGATFLDLGSMFDVFARTGGERGWRGEMYKNDQAWVGCIAKNMEGVE